MSKTIMCPKCSRSFIWDEIHETAQCSFCGTSYIMHPRASSNAQSPILMPQKGRGVVDFLTVPDEPTIRSRPVIKTYIPRNWHYQCSLAGDRFDIISNPFVVKIIFQAPDNSASIYYFDETYYKHIDHSPQTASMQGCLELPAVSRNPSFCRLRSYMTASQYCDAAAGTCGLNNLSLSEEKAPDNNELMQESKAVQAFISKGFMNVSSNWAGKTYRGISHDGQRMKVYVQARITEMMRISTVPALQMIPIGSVFGTRMMPQMVNQQTEEHFWDIQSEYYLIAAERVFDAAFNELQKIISSLDYLPGMQQARADAMAVASGAMMNMHQASSESFDRQQKIISDTNNYTSNIQQQIIAGSAASHDRIARRNSEMINEVNTYTGNGYTVQASTMYDHAYQNRQNPDIFAAQEGNSFEFGVDFEELKRRY